MIRNLFVLLILGLLLAAASCSTQNVGVDPGSELKITSGKPVGNVHELHDGPDEFGNRFAQCVDCHGGSHSMMFSWQNVNREYCYTCHPDKVDHKTGQDCMKCHDNSNGPGNN